MNSVRRLLQARGSAIWSATAQTTVHDALKLMADADVGALMILEDGQLAGIFTERDYARRVALVGRPLTDITLSEVMTRRVVYVRPEQTIQECMGLMTERHIRHLPVLDNGRPVGMVSIRDVVAHIIAEQGFIIEQLENYIMDRLPFREPTN